MPMPIPIVLWFHSMALPGVPSIHTHTRSQAYPHYPPSKGVIIFYGSWVWVGYLIVSSKWRLELLFFQIQTSCCRNGGIDYPAICSIVNTCYCPKKIKFRATLQQRGRRRLVDTDRIPHTSPLKRQGTTTEILAGLTAADLWITASGNSSQKSLCYSIWILWERALGHFFVGSLVFHLFSFIQIYWWKSLQTLWNMNYFIVIVQNKWLKIAIKV